MKNVFEAFIICHLDHFKQRISAYFRKSWRNTLPCCDFGQCTSSGVCLPASKSTALFTDDSTMSDTA